MVSMISVGITFSIVIFSLLIWWIRTITKRNGPLKKLPGPWGIPVLGYLPFLNPKAPYKNLYELSKKFGKIYEIRLGSVRTVVLSDVALIREALRRDEFTGRAPLYVTHGIMGGYGIICAEGLLWKEHRRRSTEWLKQLGMVKFGSSRSVLEKRIMSGVKEFLQSVMNEETADDNDIGNSSNNYIIADGCSRRMMHEMDPMHELHHCLGNVVNDIVFGIKYPKNDVTWKYLQELQEEGVKHIGVSGIVNFLPILRFLPNNRKTINFLLDGKKRTHKIYDNLIGKYSEALKEQNHSVISEKSKDNLERNRREIDADSHISTSESVFTTAKLNERGGCILEYFLREKLRLQLNNDSAVEFYCQEQLRHLLADLFGASVDTTLTTIRWFLLYMAKYEELQNILRSKITEQIIQHKQNDNYANNDEKRREKIDSNAPALLDLADLERVDFLKACISEMQRIRSVVPLGIPHGTNKETVLDGYRIRKNSMIIPLLWAVHMDEKIWEDPELFRPNRFLNAETGEYVPRPEFIPFQTGKRMCLGEELAKMFVTIFCGTILYNFHLELACPEQKLDMEGDCGITLTPPNYRLIFKKIN